jgi:opacity protein-like surface antigen
VTQLRLIVMVVPLLLEPSQRTLGAQSVEGGGSLAISCVGSDGSFCSEGNLVTIGPYASMWLWDRLEIGGRIVWFQLNDLRRTFTGPATVDLAVTNRTRRLAQAEFIYHFRTGEHVRPFFGLGFGQYWMDRLTTCQPVGCAATLGPGVTLGRATESRADRSVIAGLSVSLNPRLRVSGGWRYHNPFYDEFAVSEVFVGLGYRLRDRTSKQSATLSRQH